MVDILNFHNFIILFGLSLLLSCVKPDMSKEVFVMADLAYMSPAIEPQQRMLVDVVRNDTGKNKVDRLDLIVFKRTEFPTGTHVLRVLGLPLDTIRFTSEGIILNDKKLALADELSYLNARAINYAKESGGFYYEVPDRAFFLIGDNMEKALDSRFFGCVAFDDVYAIVVTDEK